MADTTAIRAAGLNGRREVKWVSVERLDLDPLNPRLPDGMEDAKQPELLDTLARDYDLMEIGQSLADNGFFSEEPLVTVPQPRSRWTVVEGNRRLAALKLLEDPDAAPKSYRARWQEISKARVKTVAEVPILEYADRREITPYLGYRHITGVLPWRPYQKARFICHLVEEDGLPFAQIARVIGSKSSTVREHYIAYTLLRQARDAFSIDTTKADVGVLRRALSDPNIRGFLGLRLDANAKDLKRPLPNKRASHAKEVLSWMFGSEDESPVLRDSRQLRNLGIVLGKSETADILRSTRDLDYAFELAGGEEHRLIDSLTKASYHLDQALPMAIRHRKSKQVIKAVAKCRVTFNQLERHFPDDDQ
jgi:hypothetical protein